MRGIVKFLATLIVGIALIWLGFWWYAETRLQSGFSDWATRQATLGWKISYDSIHRGTSPAAASLTLQNLVLTPPSVKAPVTFTLPSVTLRIQALNPLVYHTDLPNKIGMTVGDTVSLVISAGNIGFSGDLDPNALFDKNAYPFRSGDFTAGNIDLLASAGSLLVLHIDSLNMHADTNTHASAKETAVAARLAVDGLAVSPLLTRIASIPFGGKLAHLALSDQISGPLPPELLPFLSGHEAGAPPPTPEEMRKRFIPLIHQWASQGGHANAVLDAAIGPTTLHANGAVQFDANLQPNGTATLTADHLDQLIAAITNAYPALQTDAAQIQAQLSPYLTNSDQTGQALAMHVAFGKPGVLINGQKVGDLPPLDWNAAENPLAPPATTP